MAGNRLLIYSLCLYFPFHLPFQKQTGQLCSFLPGFVFCLSQTIVSLQHFKAFSAFECSNRQLNWDDNWFSESTKHQPQDTRLSKRCLRYPQPLTSLGKTHPIFFDRGPKETKEQDWDPDPAEISNKTPTEPDGSRIFLQSLAGSLWTAVHMWSNLAETTSLKQARRKNTCRTLKWGRARVTAAGIHDYLSGCVHPSASIKIYAILYYTLLAQEFLVRIQRRRDC